MVLSACVCVWDSSSLKRKLETKHTVSLSQNGQQFSIIFGDIGGTTLDLPTWAPFLCFYLTEDMKWLRLKC